MATKSTESDFPQDNMTLVECPNCGFQRYVKIEKAPKDHAAGPSVTICKCGFTSRAIVEKRKFQRHYFEAGGNILVDRGTALAEKLSITVKDLSRSGIKFAMAHRATLEPDEKIIVALEFNENRNAFFLKEATIKNIRGKTVSAEFSYLCGDIALLINQTT